MDQPQGKRCSAGVESLIPGARDVNVTTERRKKLWLSIKVAFWQKNVQMTYFAELDKSR